MRITPSFTRATRLPVPAGLSMVEAGAIPETYFTVWTNVFERGGLKPGETLLVHGGTSGIGTTAIQLAKAFGATVIATAGSRREMRRPARASARISRSITATQDFVAAVKDVDRRTRRRPDPRHGRRRLHRPQLRGRRAQDGRIVQIAFLQGARSRSISAA